MKDFEYLRAKTMGEACSLISQYREEGKILAGGQSLITLLRQRLISPSYLIDIKGISDLDYIRFDEKKGLSMGGLTTHRAIERSPLIQIPSFLRWKRAWPLCKLETGEPWVGISVVQIR
jgi:CO/xanthine dehydrogenase FAD-binding subunit